jgi:predicted cytidylate kinase
MAEKILKSIAISGSSGTGKGATAKIISHKLNFPIISAGNIMRSEAERLGKTLKELKESTRGDQFLDYWLDTTTRLAVFEKTDGVIVEGRLVAFTVPENVFKVLLVIENEDGSHDEETRYQRIASRDNLSVEKAKEATLFREEHMDDRYLSFYKIRYNELFNKDFYHLVVNTKTNNPEEAAKIVLKNYELFQSGHFAKQPEHRSLPVF